MDGGSEPAAAGKGPGSPAAGSCPAPAGCRPPAAAGGGGSPLLTHLGLPRLGTCCPGLASASCPGNPALRSWQKQEKQPKQTAGKEGQVTCGFWVENVKIHSLLAGFLCCPQPPEDYGPGTGCTAWLKPRGGSLVPVHPIGLQRNVRKSLLVYL